MARDTTDARQRNGTEKAVSNESAAETTGSEAASELSGEDLVLRYPSMDEPVIDGERLVATPGAVTALVGPNGSGKSTLLKGLAKQLTPDDGTVLYWS